VAKVRKPNFLIFGVQKAGTTFLAKHLAEHPDVFFSDPK
jgi:SpoVK/Ycf46/Vps4 family AAA+-type ATPase